MAAVGLLVSLLVDIIVIYYIANFYHVPDNTLGKALMVTILSLVIGYILTPILIGILFISTGAFMLFVFASLFIRLFLIKMVYRVGFSNALSMWIMSAIVTIVISLFLPI